MTSSATDVDALDALLGPVQDAGVPKTQIKPPSASGGAEPLPKKTKKTLTRPIITMNTPLPPQQKQQQKLDSVVNVIASRPSAAEKQEQRKRQREESERARLSEQERLKREREERELIEAAEMAERLHARKEALRQEKRKKYDNETLIVMDGTEKPKTFTITELSEAANSGTGVSADTALADALDKSLNVDEYCGQGRFPANVFVSLVTHCGRDRLNQCELGFIINGSWWRKKRFETVPELEKFLAVMKPQRIEIGSTHPSGVVSKESHAMLPLKKYLVFDIDVVDRDTGAPDGYIRACKCKGTRSVCSYGCWFLVRVGVKCLTYILRVCFDCKYIVPVFSGRRGVHIWVLDEKFLNYTEDERKGIINRIKLYGDPQKYFHTEHSVYLYDLILKECFYDRYLDGGKFIEDRDILPAITEMLPGGTQDISNDIMEHLGRLQIGEHRAEREIAWKSLCKQLNRVVPEFERAFIFKMLFPRLDEDVTIKMHHQIKAPFAMHPDTKRCSVPIPDIDKWTPDMAPRLSELIDPPDDDKKYRQQQRYRWEHDDTNKGSRLNEYITHLLKMLHEAYPLVTQEVVPRKSFKLY